ncbi:MAG: prepilin-type N-terminal cleavage/methylation domain-containing protein [Rhodocyclaceae bacterium]|nr:prepilin-type N-terminal cleavage/methylation domain-containing protein [Rhodocyclaceae bacterium]
MVTLSPANHVKINPASGFTLVEMLVVLLIVGLMAGALMTTIKISGSQQLQREAEHLAWLLRDKALESRTSGQVITWRPHPLGYAFFRQDKPDQSPAEAEIHKLPDNIKISAIHATDTQLLESIQLSGRQISGPRRITLSNPEASIEVRSEGLDLFSVAATRAPDDHANP